MRILVLSVATVAAVSACSKGDKRQLGLIETKTDRRFVEVEKKIPGESPSDSTAIENTDKAALAACTSDLGKARVQAEKLTSELEAKNGSLAALSSDFDNYKGLFNQDVFENAKQAAREGVLRKVTAELLRNSPVLPDSKFSEQLLISAADDIRQAFESDPNLLRSLQEDAIAAFHASELKASSLAYFEEHKEVEAIFMAFNGENLKPVIAKEMNDLHAKLKAKFEAARQDQDYNQEELINFAKNEFNASWERLNGQERFGSLVQELKVSVGAAADLEAPARLLAAELVRIGLGSRAFAKVDSTVDGMVSAIATESYKGTVVTWLANR